MSRMLQVRIRNESDGYADSVPLFDIQVTGKETPDEIVLMIQRMGIVEVNGADNTYQYEEAAGQFVFDGREGWFEVVAV